MRQGWSAPILALLLAVTALALAFAALSVPHQPYTGLVLQGDRVAGVIAGGPGVRAGILPGDHLAVPRANGGRVRFAPGPLSTAAPGRPLLLDRSRPGGHERVWLVPEPLPNDERRMMAVLLAVSSGFALLAGLVWSERRDRLTRTFFLLSLAFAWLLAPLPRWPADGLALAWQTVYSGITLFLPALFVHFFALFPEPAAPRGKLAAGVRAGYAIATTLFLLSLLELGRPGLSSLAASVIVILQTVAALWFTTGLVAALALFVRSYLRAGSTDARRRLRVALAGTALGAGPLAVIILVRNLSPGTEVPGERWAVIGTLLVPASFAWAVVVHRVFDLRVALRAGSLAMGLGGAGALAYLAGEWTALHAGADLGADIEGLSLAGVTLVASFAGPVGAWLRGLSTRLPGTATASVLDDWAADHAGRDGSAGDTLLATACLALRHELRLDGCAALSLGDSGPALAARAGPTAMAADAAELVRAVAGRSGVLPVDELPLARTAAEALERSGVRWVIPVGADPPRALLLLGRRIAGAWLGRVEVREIERFAGRLEVGLENAELRRAATSRGALDRELKEAGEIQAHRLPRRAPVYPTLDCAAAALSSEPVGGDYYDFVETSARDFTLAVGDAAGKGVPAALVLAGVQARFRDEARRVASPAGLLDALNRDLIGLDQPEKFMALLCAHVDVRAGRVWFANAGLMPPLVCRRDGRLEELTSGGVLLGVSAEATYADVGVELGSGDMVVLCTDGLTEARRGDELFGSERLKAVIASCRTRRAADVLEALLAAVRGFADRPLDDLTAVVLRQLTDPVREPGTLPQKTLKLQPAWSDIRR